MANHKTLPVFAFIDDSVQLEELRQYLNSVGGKLDAKGPADVSDNLIQICKQLDIMGRCPNPSEVDCILNSVCSLLVTVPAERSAEVVSAFCTALTPEKFKGQNWNSNAGHCVRVLSNIYLAFDAHPKIQEQTFRALFAMCDEANLIGELDCSIENLERQFKRWGSSIETQREILRVIHSALLKGLRADQAAKVMVMLLGTYTDADAGNAREDAAECVRTAVVDPKSFAFDHLQRLSAVKALQKSDPLMFSALELFISGTLKDYKAFVSTNPTFVSEHLKVDEDILLKKIRLLTLMTVAENKNVIDLSELSSELDITDDEALEEFIIEAVQVNAICGKINELKRQLVVSSFQHRQFGRDQWVALQKRLQGLIGNLKQTHANICSVNEYVDTEIQTTMA